jgi:hypothetical protein
MPPKPRHSAAKERENARQRRYFDEEMLQPFDDKGKPNRKFIKRYGKEIYDWKKNKL